MRGGAQHGHRFERCQRGDVTDERRAEICDLGLGACRLIMDRGSLVTALIYIGHRGEILEVGNTVT